MAQSVAAPAVPEVKEKRKFNPKIFLGIAAVAIGGYFLWRQFIPAPAPQILTFTGRIEADETDVGAKTGGRVAEILVQEGDTVKIGQIVAVIEDDEVNQQLLGAIAEVNAARQEEAQALSDISVATNRIQEAKANLAQSKADSFGRVAQAESTVAASQAQVDQARAEVKQAEAEVHRAQAQLKQAKADRDRYSQLVAQGVISRQQFEQAQTAFDSARADLDTTKATLVARIAAVKTSQKQLQASVGNLAQTRSTSLNPAIRGSQLAAFEQQKIQAQAKLAASQAKVQAAIATQNQLKKRLNSFQVKSPINGIVQDRPLEPGAVVTSGKTLITLIDPKKIYLRAYVPEGDIGHIYLGKAARVFLDSAPKQPLPAIVMAIDPKASFTPENIYFQKDRVRQVFGVKLGIQQTENYAKPGMPANAEIDLLPQGNK